MKRQGPRRTLPRMQYPYKGIVFILEIVSMHKPTMDELESKFVFQKNSGEPAPFFARGDDDILFFVQRKLDLVGLNGDRFELTNKGQFLYRKLHSEDFGIELFRILYRESQSKYRYFAQVVDSILAKAKFSSGKITADNYRSILAGTNKQSSKEIDDLLTNCGVINKLNDEISVNINALNQDTGDSEVDHLLDSVRSLVNERGSVPYSEIINALSEICHPTRLKQLESELRSHLIISATRTQEYIDGVRS